MWLSFYPNQFEFLRYFNKKKKKKEQEKINLKKLLFTFFYDIKYKESIPFFLSESFRILKKKKEETNIYISFPSHVRINKIAFHNVKYNKKYIPSFLHSGTWSAHIQTLASRS